MAGKFIAQRRRGAEAQRRRDFHSQVHSALSAPPRLKNSCCSRQGSGFFIASIVVCLVLCDSLFGQTLDPKPNWRIERSRLDEAYFDRLREIHDGCIENGLTEQAQQTNQRIRRRDLNRQTIFIPSETGLPTPSEDPIGQWQTKLNEANIWQAEQIFELAKRAADADAGGAAIQLLNEVLHFNPDHAQVRKALAHRKNGDGWSIYPDRLNIRPATRASETCGWPARSYLVATTPNFLIESNASPEQTQQLAEKLERWHYVWRQVFLDYWGNAKNVNRWIKGESAYTHRKTKLKIVFFQSRRDYLATLVPLVPGVEVSTGYYNNQYETSFFYYDSDPSVEDTWRHELTHQLFRESIGASKNLKSLENEYIWLDEGAATWFESLCDLGEYVELGGFESRRLLFARLQLLLEDYQLPMADLARLGRTGLQQRPDIGRVYNQMAGQFTMLMNDEAGAYQSALIQSLSLLYSGKALKPGKFEEWTGKKYVEWDQRYKEFLVVDAESIAEFLSAPLTRTALSFPKSGLNDSCFEAIGRCHNLVSLDVSENQIRPAYIERLTECRKLQQLILCRSQLEPGTLRALSRLPQLTELNLTGSLVTDQQLLELQGQQNLKTITLRATHVTPAGIAKLTQLLPKLSVVQ